MSAAAGAFESNHYTTDGKPDGGSTSGPGLLICWQRGPLVDDDGNHLVQTGAFVETVIAAAHDRISHYQATQFNCAENAEALEHLEAALAALNRRIERRQAEGVQGTHQV